MHGGITFLGSLVVQSGLIVRGRTAKERRGEGRDCAGDRTPCTESKNTGWNQNQSPTATDSNGPSITEPPQNRGTPRIHLHHEDQPPAHQPCNHLSPRTEPEITSRNRSQSIPKPVCTGATNHRTTAKPQNSKYLLAELQSSTIKSAAQPARATDRTGEHEPKTSSVHAGTDRHTATNHGTTAKQRNTRGHRYHGNQPQPSRPPKTPETRTEPENTHRKPIQSTRASAVTRTAATPVPQTARLQRPMNTTKTSHWHINYPTAHNFRDY